MRFRSPGDGSKIARQVLHKNRQSARTSARPGSTSSANADWEIRVITKPSPWDVPAPVLLNTHKHHAGFLRERIRSAIGAGQSGLQPLADELVVVGSKLMDLYHGPFSPREIADRVLGNLRKAGRHEAAGFQPWVESAGGYQTIEFPEDMSRWVLRMGDEAERFVHVHPARYSPFTIRVRANVLTTAVLVLACTGIRGGDPLGRSVVNSVRRDYLGLAPVGRDPSADEGIGAVIELLR